MKKQRKLWSLITVFSLSVFYMSGISANVAEANNTPQTIPFAQNWSTNIITTNDDWSGVNGIIGYLGDITTTTQANIDARTIIQPFTTHDVVANLTNAASTAGGVGEFELPNPTIGLQGSGTADAPNIVIHLNTAGQSNIRVMFNARDIDDTADDAVQQLNVQYRVGNTGNFINVPGGYFADVTTGPNQATLVTPVDVTLPVAANNQPLVEVRTMTVNAAGTDEWVGIDDISVTTAAGNVTNRTNLDINGDGRTDFAVSRGTQPDGPATTWVNMNGTGSTLAFQFGLMSDIPVPEDFDGDGKDDIAVWRAGAQAVYYIIESGTGTLRIEQFGQDGDDPGVTGDYDGDGKADPAVYRSGAQGYFYYRGSLNNPNGQITFVPFGGTSVIGAVSGDYDGDGKYDFCVRQPSSTNPANGQFVILRSSDGAVEFIDWGLANDLVVPGDFDGDGRSDFCVIRPNLTLAGEWYILERDGGGTGAQPIVFGSVLTDVPAPGDYDGDGRTDVAVWRESANAGQTGFWVRNSSFGGAFGFTQWGQQGDYPIAPWNVRGLD